MPQIFTPSSSTEPLIAGMITVKGVSYEMVAIPGGTFQMGSENDDSDEKPVHRVTVSSFQIGKTEVTQGLWQAVMGDNPSYFKKGANYPVEMVSWEDCQAFIKKLNQLTGGNYRLPSEAEWEYACRAGTTGDTYGKLENIAWYYGNSNESTHPVGLKQANAFGLYDMLGNVLEWCQDWYRKKYYVNYPVNNPSGPTDGSFRVLRGGGWMSDPGGVRCVFRFRGEPGNRSRYSGFRLAAGLASGG